MFRPTAVRRPMILLAAGALAVAGCASPQQDDGASADASAPATATSAPSSAPATSGGMDHGSMHGHHGDGGPPPAGIESADDARFPAGSTVTLTADHMPGMKGAKATVVGAYDTTTYAVTYTPTSGGNPVTDHKWVVQEELEGVGDDPLAVGDSAVMTAEHMPGMKGANATITQVTDEPVYIVDVDAPDMPMKNHKWVVQSEMTPTS